jgi:cytochrome P450
MTENSSGRFSEWIDKATTSREIGGTDGFLRDPGQALSMLAAGVDDVVAARIGERLLLLVVSPELVRQLLIGHADDTTKGPGVQRIRWLLGDGLLTSEGETHRRARRLVAPAFTRVRLKRYTEVMGERAQRRGRSWESGAALDVHAEMAALTLEIVGETLLGVDLTDEAAPLRHSLNTALGTFARQDAGLGGRLTGGEDPAEVDNSRLESLISEIVAGHVHSGDRGDVVSGLLAATDDETGSRLSYQEVRDNVVTLLMAGHETTANALSWTFHLLGAHPEIAVRLRDEVAVLEGRQPGFDELSTLRFTRAVLTEAMRLYPPVWMIGRTATRSFALGSWNVEEGTTVIVSPRVLHRRPEWYPAPDDFDPDRWLDDRAERVPRYAYLPFGLGPRSCIGEQFAWTELVILLAVLAARWRLEPQPGHLVEPQYRVTLRPRDGLPMTARAW